MSKKKFTRTQIQEIFIAELGMDTRKANDLASRIVKAMSAALAAGEMIELRGFGSLEVKERKAWEARNPQTGKPVNVPPRRKVVFRPGRELKEALNRTAP